MLLRFGVTNHRSLRERQELSLVASSLDGSEDGLIECRHAPGGRLVPAAVIYGANASGKSNLVRALQWMRTAVLESHRGSTAGEVVPRRPFALDAASASMPSAFDIDFVSGGVIPTDGNIDSPVSATSSCRCRPASTNVPGCNNGRRGWRPSRRHDGVATPMRHCFGRLV